MPTPPPSLTPPDAAAARSNAAAQQRPTETRSYRLPEPLLLGIVGSVILALSSFGGGASRNRGGILDAWNIGFLAFGHGRNIMMFLFWVGLFLLVAAWILAGYQLFVEKRGVNVHRLLLGWLTPLAFAGPLASRDVYSYLMQGAMVRDGFDPYSEGATVNPGPFLLEVSHDWRNTTTPYGPLHLWVGEGVTTIVGDNVALGIIVYKIISLAGFAMIAWAVPRLARALGGDEKLALWLSVANPVLILHLVGGMHNESIMVGLVSIGLVMILRHDVLGCAGGLALIGLAVAYKATAFIAVPFVVWIMLNHLAPRETSSVARRLGAFVVAGFIAVAEIIAAVAAVTWMSGSSWGWISEISGNSKVINPLAVPTLLADSVVPIAKVFNPEFSYNQTLSFFRGIFVVLMLVGLVTVWWLFRKNDRDAIAGTAAAYQVAFLFNSVTLPWYYASVITLLGVFSPSRLVTKIAVGASVFLALAFSGDGNHQLYNWWWIIGTVALGWWAAETLFPHPAADEAPASSAKTAAA